MVRTKIIGLGHAVPDRIVSNSDLENMMDTSDEWITERSGIKERRHVDIGQTTSDLAIEATKMALENSGVKPDEVELIVFCSISSDHFFPGGAVQIQEKLGMRNIGAFDLRAACSGFIYGLSVADQFIRNGSHKTILLIGAEVQSIALMYDNDHRDMAVLLVMARVRQYYSLVKMEVVYYRLIFTQMVNILKIFGFPLREVASTLLCLKN